MRQPSATSSQPTANQIRANWYYKSYRPRLPIAHPTCNNGFQPLPKSQVVRAV